MKPCAKCRQSKPFDAFYVVKGRPSSWCRACTNASSKASYEKNREARNKRIVLVRRARQLGLTYEEYIALPNDPGEQCAVCGSPPDGRRNCTYRSSMAQEPKKKNLAVDHCHKTGVIRGFLCSHCNRALGLMDDDPALIRALADYVEGGGQGWETRPPQRSGRKQQTHCQYGHPMSGDNLVVAGSAKARLCRECRNRRQREYNAKKRQPK